MRGLLLDTCAILWTGKDQRIAAGALHALAEWLPLQAVHASPFSAWEISLLTVRGRLSLPLDVDVWFESYLARGGIQLAPLPIGTLIAAHTLPGAPPKDPADRILIATARQENLAIVTRDRRILDYGEAGLVQTVVC